MIVALTEIPALEPVGPVLLVSIAEDGRLVDDPDEPLPPRCVSLKEKATSLLASPKYKHASLISLDKRSAEDTLVRAYSWMLDTYFTLNGETPGVLSNTQKLKQLILRQVNSGSTSRSLNSSKCALL